MPRSREEEARILSRRSKVAAMLLRGITNQLAITANLGMEPGQRATISRDIAAIKAEWRSSAVRDFDEVKGRELDKLDVLESEYWQAWERSCKERQVARTSRKNGASGTVDEAEVRKEQRDGNPAFLDGVLRCIAKRCEITGITKEGGTTVAVMVPFKVYAGFDPGEV